MIVFGTTGPIGHGKSTFAKALERIEPKTVRFESSDLIADVVNELHQRSPQTPSRDDIESINRWLEPLNKIVKDDFGIDCDPITISIDDATIHPVEYEKLFLHIDNLKQNPKLKTQNVNDENKEAYRPILQWIGGYLVKHVDQGIWYDKLAAMAEAEKAKGTQIVLVGGLRFPNDALILRQHGAIIVKIYRPEHFAFDILDPTERERDNIKPDITIVSDGTIEDMNKKSAQILEDIKSGKQQKTYHTKSLE